MSAGIPVPASPRVLWVELTSKCAFDCVFCSRRVRRGAGEHMPFELYRSLIGQLVQPRTLILNYSGESTYYPELFPAISVARQTEANVELVTVLASLPEASVEALARSGLTRITVSIHATDPDGFRQIYRFSTFEALRSRLERLLATCRSLKDPPSVDAAFVAMDRNVDHLADVAEYIHASGIGHLLISPVTRRDTISEAFPEIEGAFHTASFRARLQQVVEETRLRHPALQISMCDPFLAGVSHEPGAVPVFYPARLPSDAKIHTCEQNPRDTAHVLSNGDVVPCEVLDWMPFGSLQRSSLSQIWHGPEYTAFRQRFSSGATEQCRTCPWKQVYKPGPLSHNIVASRGRNAQLLYGWHEPVDRGIIWSTQSAAAVLRARPHSRTLHVNGLLPSGNGLGANTLTVTCNGIQVGRVDNPWDETIPFGLDFPVDPGSRTWDVGFHTSVTCRPKRRGDSSDDRDLGFALVLMESKEFADPERKRGHSRSLARLRRVIAAADRMGVVLRTLLPSSPPRLRAWKPGLSVIIPERDNREELAACLAALSKCLKGIPEPVQVIVAVNGASEAAYADLQRQYPEFRWFCDEQPRDFSRAIEAGLLYAEHDWTYLLNNDVTLNPGALTAVLAQRAPDVFAVASQILLKDPTRFREETNWTRLHVNDTGTIDALDVIPTCDGVLEGAYAGGGASLFRTALLRRYIPSAACAYAPFCWEDIEWGWRARKAGFRVLFCSDSIAHHTHRATISKHYSEDQVDIVLRRNRILFQLRNLTQTGSLDQTLKDAANLPDGEFRRLLSPTLLAAIGLARIRNHLAPAPDASILS